MPLADLQEKIANWNPGSGRHSWSERLEDRGWTLTLTTDQTDALSCLVWELTLGRENEADIALAAMAQEVAERVVSLPEPLTVYEIDSSRGVALLRSQTPEQRDGLISYFEVQLDGPHALTLRRFQIATQPSARRAQVAIALTHDMIARFVDDVTG